MYKPDFNGKRGSMFICGDNESAKEQVSKLLDRFGWDSEDFGSSESGEAIESLCALWCIPYFKEGKRNHAFSLIK